MTTRLSAPKLKSHALLLYLCETPSTFRRFPRGFFYRLHLDEFDRYYYDKTNFKILCLLGGWNVPSRFYRRYLHRCNGMNLNLQNDLLHVLRNPYGHGEDLVREARLSAADLLEEHWTQMSGGHVFDQDIVDQWIEALCYDAPKPSLCDLIAATALLQRQVDELKAQNVETQAKAIEGEIYYLKTVTVSDKSLIGVSIAIDILQRRADHLRGKK